MKLDKNILFASGTVVVGIMALVVAVLLFRGISSFSAEEKGLKGAITRLRHFYKKKPFPSQENIEKEKENKVKLDEWYSKFVAGLQQGQVCLDPGNKSPSIFIGVYGKTQGDLIQKSKENVVKLSGGDDFAFGFEKEAAGAPPPPDDVPTLTQQLTMIKRISHLLMDSNVKEISLITRGKLKSAQSNKRRRSTGPGMARAGSSSRGRSSAGRGQKKAVTVSRVNNLPVNAAKLYSKQHFTIHFRAKEQVVLKILNKLAKEGMFCVVTSLEMVRIGNDIRSSENSTASKDDEVIKGGVSKYPDSIYRMVCGIDQENVMDVKLSLTIYNFQGN
ncbi:MAG: Amuc_1100 family pilus-like protein [Kiritimatiellae bacterium]|nr:Amuc_1100 family pilus-like protein [Kiritimatiellia bacterium]